MAGYGIGTDYFGLVTLATPNVKLVSSKATLLSASVAKAQDENGNEVAETKFAADGPSEVECVYDVIAGTVDTSSTSAWCAIGDIGADTVCTGQAGKTSNGSWPQITVKGVYGTGLVAKFTNVNKWTMPAFTITGKRSAALIGATLTGGSVTGSSFSMDAKVDYHRESGLVVACALTGAELKVTNEGVETTGTLAFAPAAPFAATDQITTSVDTKATDYATGSIEMTKTYNHS
jgi:hypothetical protein